jgi:hypothetical protein
VASGSTPVCACDDGYHPDGLSCVANGAPSADGGPADAEAASPSDAHSHTPDASGTGSDAGTPDATSSGADGGAGSDAAHAPDTGAVATGMRPMNVVFYGTHDAPTDQRIIAAKPLFLYDNTPNGPWHGNCDAAKFAAAGIRVFSYIDGGYEGTQARQIPNDLASNLAFIDAIATEAGVYGIFLDEVTDFPDAASLSYVQQIYQRCHARGLALVVNTGVDSWDSALMQYCDFMQSSERWAGASPTSSQAAFAARTFLLSELVTDATTAASLTNLAHGAGFGAHFAGEYNGLQGWFETYVAAVPTLP